MDSDAICVDYFCLAGGKFSKCRKDNDLKFGSLLKQNGTNITKNLLVIY